MTGEGSERPLLGQRLRLRLRDGRVVTGVLEAVDSDRNVVLSRGEQTGAGPQRDLVLALGYVTVPGHAVESVEVEVVSASAS